MRARWLLLLFVACILCLSVRGGSASATDDVDDEYGNSTEEWGDEEQADWSDKADEAGSSLDEGDGSASASETDSADATDGDDSLASARESMSEGTDGETPGPDYDTGEESTTEEDETVPSGSVASSIQLAGSLVVPKGAYAALEKAGRCAMEEAADESTQDTVSTLTALVSSNALLKTILGGFTKTLVENSTSDAGDFLELFKDLVNAHMSPHVIAEILAQSHLKMALPAMSTDLFVLLGDLDGAYFAQVFNVLGGYLGWVMTSYYMTGDLLPSNWDDRKTVAARVMIAIHLEDMDELRDIGRIMGTLSPEDYASARQGYWTAFQESLEALSGSHMMLEMLGLLDQVLGDGIDAETKGQLAIEHLESMSDHSRTSFCHVLRNLMLWDDPIMNEAVLRHLGKPIIATPQNVDLFIRCLIDNEIPAAKLSSYLSTLPRLPPKVARLDEGVSDRLSKLDSVRHFLDVLNVIAHRAAYSPLTMISILAQSKVEGCNRAVGRVYLAIRSGKPEELRKAWEAVEAPSLRERSARRLVSALEKAAHDAPEIFNSWKVFFSRKLFNNTWARALLREHGKKYPIVAKLLAPKRSVFGKSSSR